MNVRVGALILVAAAAATALTGCGNGMGAKLTYNDTEKTKITDIVLSGGSGDVTVTTGSASETHITRIVRSDGRDPAKSYQVSGGTLSLDTTCGRNCSVSYEVEAPAGVKVGGELHSGAIALVGVGAADVKVSSGDIRLERIAGDVTARATSGSIDAHALSGAATLTVTSGNIEGLELTGGKPLTAEASSGDVELHVLQPASISARASSGNVELIVPKGDYQLKNDTGSGDFTTDLRNIATATNVISVRVGSGDAKVMSF
ncbi:DUF4097 family beta strand repeat-containing protein [Actinoplanes sp. NPDC051494]|uniref:DUF4097 family beta strand repeat-containing protein n=1 Tax=Actinoplanes sp. NPDC051494 TaxID=3363907 RepID=UPI00378A9570